MEKRITQHAFINSFCKERLIFQFIPKIVSNRSYLTVLVENLKTALTKGKTIFCFLHSNTKAVH